MMRLNYGKLFIGFSALLTLVATTRVDAYELATHARLTLEAFNRSMLVDSQFLKDLGIDSMVRDSSGYTLNPFGTIYYDVSGSAVNERQANPNGVAFDARFLGLSTENPDQTFIFPAWLMRGAIREDDLGYAAGFTIGSDPHDDPYGPFWRVMNHFYDPVNNSALRLNAVQAGAFSLATGESTNFHAAPNWATGTQDAFAQSPIPEEGRRNHFTVFDAREAMYRALTGKKKDGTDIPVPSGSSPTSERDKYWATLFRALGDIVHLVEDMAQPQHTRNDMHSGVLGFGHASVYEAYLDCRATGGQFEYIDNYQDNYIDSCYPLTYDGHPTPVFTRYADYFATRDGTGRGLAEYSNRNFFSFGTNLGSNNYPSPSNNRSLYDEEAFLQFDTFGFQRTVKFLRGNVTDTRTGETNNIRLTTESAFDYFLGTARTYSLNAYNYDDQADLLIPRAVAYSAGFIDYFFRGRIEAEDAHYADTGIKLKIKNAIDPEKYAEWQNEILYAKNSTDTPSTLWIAYEYQDENNITQYGTSDAVDLNTSNGDDDVAPGKVSREVYAFPMTVPSGKIRNLKYRLVFRGRLGDEDDAVVTAAFKPVSGFLVNPNYLPQDEIPGARMIYKTATGWKLAPDEGLVAGNIDWKGWYEGNPVKPTKVLSWMGPTSRYFGVPFRGGSITNDPNNQSEENLFAPEIYHNGEIFSVAPKPVLGSALIKDASNMVWIVAVCRDGYADVIYRRPYKKSSSAAIYNPDTAKDGWREIGRSIPGAGDREPGTPWFFKGDGTEAQTMRKWVDPNDQNERVRFKRLIVNIDINAPSASVSPKANDPVGFVGNTQCSADYDADGAGTGTLTSLESGSYVIAVDYNNMTEVLATVDENSTRNTTTTVTVTKDANGNVTSTKTNTTLSGNQAASLTQSPGGSPIMLLQSSVTDIDGVTSDTYKNAEISYYLDLRKKLYVYYQQEWNQAEQKVSDTTVSGAGDYAEHMYVLPEQPPDLFSNVYTYSYTSQITPPEGVFSCDSSYPATTRYEPNFGWVDNLDIGGGGWAVDVNGNVLVSQKFYSDAGYEVHDAFNYLKDGDINAVLGITAGAPAYYPVGVLH